MKGQTFRQIQISTIAISLIWICLRPFFGHQTARHYVMHARSGFASSVRERAAKDPAILLYTPASMLRPE
jgi:hypothetical protein